MPNDFTLTRLQRSVCRDLVHDRIQQCEPDEGRDIEWLELLAVDLDPNEEQEQPPVLIPTPPLPPAESTIDFRAGFELCARIASYVIDPTQPVYEATAPRDCRLVLEGLLRAVAHRPGVYWQLNDSPDYLHLVLKAEFPIEKQHLEGDA